MVNMFLAPKRGTLRFLTTPTTNLMPVKVLETPVAHHITHVPYVCHGTHTRCASRGDRSVWSRDVFELVHSTDNHIISKLIKDIITNMQVYSVPTHSSAAEEIVPVFSQTCQKEALQQQALIHLMKEFQLS